MDVYLRSIETSVILLCDPVDMRLDLDTEDFLADEIE